MQFCDFANNAMLLVDVGDHDLVLAVFSAGLRYTGNFTLQVIYVIECSLCGQLQ